MKTFTGKVIGGVDKGKLESFRKGTKLPPRQIIQIELESIPEKEFIRILLSENVKIII